MTVEKHFTVAIRQKMEMKGGKKGQEHKKQNEKVAILNGMQNTKQLFFFIKYFFFSRSQNKQRKIHSLFIIKLDNYPENKSCFCFFSSSSLERLRNNASSQKHTVERCIFTIIIIMLFL